MKRVYLDNAATTPMLPEVSEVMMNCMQNTFGNPSSTHAFGRSAKAVIENARKNIAKKLNTNTNEIVFTSGGTEADNLILKNAIDHLGVTHIISSKLEHHAVLKTIEFLQKKEIKITYVDTFSDGTLDYDHLTDILNQNTQKALISLMYVNNEIGTILDIHRVITLKNKHNVWFHTDAVQAIGHFNIDLRNLDIDFLAVSAHKFHGPKGIGFAYFKNGTGIQPEILGGEQERGTRAGTENTAGVLGLEKALQLCLQHIDDDILHLKNIKKHFIRAIKKTVPTIKFNGVSDDLQKSTHTVINIQFDKDLPMLLFQLDLKGIAVSGGSACQSGAHKGSHVLQQFLNDDEQQNTSLRVSFSKLTTKDDIDIFIKVISEII